MMAWTEQDSDGTTVTTLYGRDEWSAVRAIACLAEEDGNWEIELSDDSFTMNDPKGDSTQYLMTLFGLNDPPSVDKEQPFMNYRSGLLNFDVWEVR
tara:strand:+ start:4250 stop:4537 length:288 start_codon:yes stop_codon:yes gene_type:complete